MHKTYPLVTFIVVAYNQESYIKEAIEGAFSQTYTNLEILLSDDNSSDSTYEIMKKMAAEYSGNHKIVLNKNDPNLGIGGHINRVMEIAKGEFIVVNAGDDISLPERTSELVNVWLKSGRETKSICSDCFKMDTNGEVYGSFRFKGLDRLKTPLSILEYNAHIHGATHGWDRCIFDQYLPLDSRVVHEDRVLPLRSALLGKVEHIEKPLLKYRDGGISSKYSKQTVSNILYGEMLKSHYRHCVDYEQKIADLNYLKQKLPTKHKYDALLKCANIQLAYYKFICQLAESKNNKESLLYHVVKSGVKIKKALPIYLKYRFQVLFSLYLKIKVMV